jgi:hypothetical protein
MLGSCLVSAQEEQVVHSRASARDLLKGNTATSSFDALVALLAAGHEVVVTDQAGRRRRGKVLAVSSDAILLDSPVAAGVWEAMLPLYWPLDVGLVLKRHVAASTARSFPSESVTRIDIVDPAGNGTAIGAVVGFSLAAGTYLWERRRPPSNLKGLATSVALVLGVPVSLRMGHVMDRAINDPIYERTSRTPRASIIPEFGRDSGGVAVTLQW